MRVSNSGQAALNRHWTLDIGHGTSIGTLDFGLLFGHWTLDIRHWTSIGTLDLGLSITRRRLLIGLRKYRGGG
jgi:hypothetical protein